MITHDRWITLVDVGAIASVMAGVILAAVWATRVMPARPEIPLVTDVVHSPSAARRPLDTEPFAAAQWKRVVDTPPRERFVAAPPDKTVVPTVLVLAIARDSDQWRAALWDPDDKSVEWRLVGDRTGPFVIHDIGSTGVRLIDESGATHEIDLEPQGDPR